MNLKQVLLLAGIGLLICSFSNPVTSGKRGNRRNFELNADDATDYSKLLKGKFILEGSTCAGLDFISAEKATWTNELDCDHPDLLRIRWIDNVTFMTVTQERINENCPPGIDIYKVKSFDKKVLKLTSIWAGWGNFKDDELVFVQE